MTGASRPAAPAASAASARLVARMERFFEEIPVTWDGATIETPLRDAPGTEATGTLNISIVDMFLRETNEMWKATDHLVVLSVRNRHATASGTAGALWWIAGPEAIRNASSTDPNGIVTTDLELGGTPWPRTKGVELEISLALLRVARNTRSRRVIDTIETMIPAIDQGSRESVSWIDAIMDRIDVLGFSPQGTWVFAGTLQCSLAPRETRYCAFLGPGQDPSGSTSPLSVHDRRLREGPEAQATTPARDREFVLLSIGRPIRERPVVSVRQFIRERARVRPAIDTRDDQRHLERQARIRRMLRLTQFYGAAQVERTPIVTPIALEVARDLIPLVVSDEAGSVHPDFGKKLSTMRAGLLYELGVEYPGTRIRGNEIDLPDGSYIILLDETPLVSGTVRKDRHLCNETVERLALLNIRAEPATNPANGNDCALIGDADVEVAQGAGLTTWDASGYLILHLASVLRKNARDFIGIGATADRLRRLAGAAGPYDADRRFYEAVRGAPGGLPALATVLELLVEEETPIHALEVIARTFIDLHADRSTLEIVEHIRGLDSFRDRLVRRFSRDGTTALHAWHLGENFVSALRAGTHFFGDAAALALEPNTTQELLATVRQAVMDVPPTLSNPFLLVEDWRLRRPLRKLVELEFPHLAVLSSRELRDVADDRMVPIGVIELDSPDGGGAE